MTIKRNKSDNYLSSGFVSFDLTQVRVLLLLLWLSEKWANWLLIGKLSPNFFMYIQYVFFIVLSGISIVNWKVCSQFYAEIFISGKFYKYWKMKLLICSSFWFLNHEGETLYIFVFVTTGMLMILCPHFVDMFLALGISNTELVFMLT